MAESCALKRVKLTDYIANLEGPSSRGSRVSTGVKAGFVGSVVTPLRALAGNSSMVPLVHVGMAAPATAFDIIVSHGKSAAGGFKIPAHKFRTYANALDLDGLGVAVRGFKRGLKPVTESYRVVKAGERSRWRDENGNHSTRNAVASFVDGVRTRLDADRASVPNSTVEYKRTIYKSQLAQTLSDAAFTILEAADRPFWHMGYDTSMYMQAKGMGIAEGLTGKALKKRSSDLMANPTEEMVFRAEDEANFSTFKDKNVLSESAGALKGEVKRRATAKIDPDLQPWERRKAEGLKSSMGVVDYLLETWLLPFVGVPSSVAAKMGSFSPYGVVQPDIYRPMLRRKGRTGEASAALQREQVKALGKATTGSLLAFAGMQAYNAGMLTFGDPTDATERAQWKAAGKQAWSVKINGHWVGLKSLGPVASGLFMGAALQRGLDKTGAEVGLNAETAGGLAQGLGSGGQFLTEQTYLQTIGNTLAALKEGEDRPDKALRVALSAALPVPALSGQLSRAADPFPRDSRGLAGQLKGKLPFGHLYAPNPRDIGPYGPLPEKTGVERFSAAVSPFPIKKDRDNDVLREIRKLGVSFGVPDRAVRGKVGGVKVGKKMVGGQPRSGEMTMDEVQFIATVAGGRALERITARISEPDWKDMSDEDKKTELDKIVQDARKPVRDPIKEAVLAAAQPRKKRVRR